jgi:hypothetical protein
MGDNLTERKGINVRKHGTLWKNIIFYFYYGYQAVIK